VTLAGLFWAWGDNDVMQRLVRKVLMVGTFVWILNNFANLSTILFQSFAGLGLKASGSSMALADFLKPGTLAAEGLRLPSHCWMRRPACLARSVSSPISWRSSSCCWAGSSW
jgi:type IV secretory pathway TrbL component